MRNVLLAILAALLLFAFWLAAYSRAPLSPAITAAPANYPPIRDTNGVPMRTVAEAHDH
jgi:hypothetical protein